MFSKSTKKLNIFFVAALVVLFGVVLSHFSPPALAYNEQINYQGKLLDNTGSPVADGTYSIVFRLYDVPTLGTHLWTETQSVSVQNGLFSVMLGTSTALSSVDFTQTLYLGVNVQADGEMTPRKILGLVPAAFEAENTKTFDNYATTSFVRADAADTISGSDSSPMLSIIQNGAGSILSLFDGVTEIFTAADGGGIGIGTTTPGHELVVNGDVQIIGGIFDNNGTTGSNGYVLQSTSGGIQWVATSTLGLTSPFGASIDPTELTATDFGDFTCNGTTCSLDSGTVAATELAAGIPISTFTNDVNYLTDITGSLFTDLSDTPSAYATNEVLYMTASAVTSSSTFLYTGSQLQLGGDGLSLTGTTANIALGSNYLSGDGDDEGIAVDSTGNVGIGVSSPTSILDISTVNGANLTISRSDTIVTGGNQIGAIKFRNNDANLSTQNIYAQIVVNAGNDITTDAANGVMYFQTTGTTAAGSPTTRLAIDASGNIAFGNYTTPTPVDSGALTLHARSPNNKSTELILDSQGTSVNARSSLYFQKDGVTNAYVIAGHSSGTADGYLAFGTHNGSSLSESMRLNTDGSLGIGTTTPVRKLSVAGSAIITGALYDNSDSAGTNGYVLQSTGTGFNWVATSSLGLGVAGGLVSADIDTSAELAAIVGDETGSGALVFATAPTLSSTTLSGNTAIGTITSGTWNGSVIGSNYGGAGSVNGLLKANGSGVVSAAVAGTDYESGITASNGLTRTSNDIALGGSLTGNTTIAAGNSNTLTITSSLTSGARTSSPLFISQANDASNNSSASLIQLTNSDTGSTAALLSLNQNASSNGNGIAINSLTGGTSITVANTTGTAFNANTLTTGTGLTATGLTSGAAVVAGIGDDASTASALRVTNSSNMNTDYTGALINLSPTRTLAAAATRNNTGNYLRIQRSNVTNNASANLTVSGELVKLASDCTQTLGTCTDSSNILTLTQSYAAASGALLNVTGAGTGNLATFDASNSSANGLLVDLQSSSASQYVFRATSNNGATLGITVNANGSVGVGTTTPARTLSVAGSAIITGALYDNSDSAGTNGYVLQSTGTGFNWVATSSLGVGSPFGASIDPTELTATDFGDFTCNGTTCSLDSGTVAATELAAGIPISTFTNDVNYLTDITGSLFTDLSDTPAAYATNEVLYMTASAVTSSSTFVYTGERLGVGTTSPARTLSVAGSAIITGALYDNSDSAGTNGMVLQSTGTGFTWVATSTLGLGGGASTFLALTDTQSSFTANRIPYTNSGATALTDSSLLTFDGLRLTTTDFSVLGTSTFANTLTLSGSAANIALGSNWLSGDGDDEGLFVGSAGYVGIGTSTPGSLLTIAAGEDSPFLALADSTNNDQANIYVGTTSPNARISAPIGSLYIDTVSGMLYQKTGDDNGNTSWDAFSQGTTTHMAQMVQAAASSTPSDQSFVANFDTVTYDQGGLADVGTDRITIKRAGKYLITANNQFAAGLDDNEQQDLRVYKNGTTELGYDRTHSNNTNQRVTNTWSGVYELQVGDYITMEIRHFEGAALNTLTTISERPTLSVTEVGRVQNVGTGSLFTDAGSDSYLTDEADNLLIGTSTNSAAAKLVIRQQNASDIVNIFDGSTEVFTIMDGGNVGVGSSTPLHTFSVAGDIYASGALYDNANSAGTNGYVLQSTGTGFNWVATSSLGFAATSDFDTSAELAAILGDETGSGGGGLAVFSNNPTLAGATISSTLTLSGSAANIALGTNYLSGDGDDEGIYVTSAGRVGIGTTTPEGILGIERLAVTGSAVAGIDRNYGLANSTLSAVQYGDKTYIKTTNTATTTIVGNMIRLEDSTAYGNTIRGLEVQAHRGTNTLGENTALSGFARTFGVRGTTEGDAGALYEPAGVFAETKGTTQGNALRAYSASITSADLVSLFQNTSTFTGTGLVMNFGNSGGSFNASTSKFIDFQNAGTSKFVVTAHGTTTIGDGTTNYQAGLQIGYGGLCVDNDGSCNASTTGQISSVSSATGNSDLAEMYFSSQALQPGELVVSDGFISIRRATGAPEERVLGVVSTKPGLLLGYDDTSLVAGQKGYPLALTGRVPVMLSDENGEVHVGDPLTLSSKAGIAMKATGNMPIVGYALESFDGTHAYTEGYIDQFGDDIAAPQTEALNVEQDERINDGCSFGAGGATGETDADCLPSLSSTEPNDTEVVDEVARRYEAEQAALAALRTQPAATYYLADGNNVKVGRVIMFVDKGYELTDDTLTLLDELTSTSTDVVTGAEEGSEETLWSRLKYLAQNFVDGVLTLAGIRTDRIETRELCVDDVCVDANDLRALLEASQEPHTTISDTSNVPSVQDQTVESTNEPDVVDTAPLATSTPATETETPPEDSGEPADDTITDSLDAVEPEDLVNPEADEPAPPLQEPEVVEEAVDASVESVDSTSAMDEEVVPTSSSDA